MPSVSVRSLFGKKIIKKSSNVGVATRRAQMVYMAYDVTVAVRASLGSNFAFFTRQNCHHLSPSCGHTHMI